MGESNETQHSLWHLGITYSTVSQPTRALPSNSDLSTSFSCLLNMNDKQGSLCISGMSPILKTETKTKQECWETEDDVERRKCQSN